MTTVAGLGSAFGPAHVRVPTARRSRVPASNGVGTLAKELAYAYSVTGLGLQVIDGTTPFSSPPLAPPAG